MRDTEMYHAITIHSSTYICLHELYPCRICISIPLPPLALLRKRGGDREVDEVDLRGKGRVAGGALKAWTPY